MPGRCLTATAVERLLQHGRLPHVLLLDWQLPGLSGREALAFLRERFDEVSLPVLVLTASPARETLEVALSTGANDFVPKPYNDVELLARVRVRAQAEALGEREDALRIREADAQAARALAEGALGDVQAVTDALLDSGVRLQLVIDTLPSLINFVDAEGRYVLNNRAYAEWFGVQVGALRGRTVREVIGEENYQHLAPLLERARAGEAVEYEAPFIFGGGRRGYIHGTHVPYRGPDGELRGYVSLVQDVTERRRSEAALRESEERFCRLTEAGIIGILEWDASGAFTAFANPDYLKLVPDADILGKPLAEALPGMAEQGFARLLDQVVATGVPYVGTEVPVTLPHHAPDTVDYMNFVFQPMRGPQGEVNGVLVCAFEVTDQVLARQASERLAAELQVRADVERQLIGIVSHDLRNPLNAILLSATTLLSRPELDERQEKVLRRMLKAAERMRRMVHDLLDFTQARLGTGLAVQRRLTDLNALVRQVVDEVALVHPGQEVHFVAEGEAQGVFDPDRIAQLLSNLLTNALVYGVPGLPVRVTTRAEASHLVLEVHNMGDPIPPERLERLFQSLERGAVLPAHSSRSIGLGLFIVESIVRAHGGTIRVHSTAEQGTTLRVSLPR
ncbi:hybrid sensor histidine kinase/response regulator [Corallococcus sicarius]|uniref:histidine kinase n=1 Tax=Corallococcus sicarius TaxID=2316726 RepID=A0A3A8P377_9BACT|nr:PAS domain-containing protein [Corallococcus sicarius]RKH46214.1 PAS domain S-box protein [Corallococcus sicarius]